MCLNPSRPNDRHVQGNADATTSVIYYRFTNILIWFMAIFVNNRYFQRQCQIIRLARFLGLFLHTYMQKSISVSFEKVQPSFPKLTQLSNLRSFSRGCIYFPLYFMWMTLLLLRWDSSVQNRCKHIRFALLVSSSIFLFFIYINDTDLTLGFSLKTRQESRN